MKKIFSFLAAMMLLVGSASATTIYCQMDKDWWKADDAAVGVYTWDGNGNAKVVWPGERMTPVDGVADVWSFDIDTAIYHMCIFTRVNGEGDIADWGAKTGDQVIPTDGKNLFTIANAEACWNGAECVCDGAWSVYGEEEPVANEWAKIVWTAEANADDIAEDASYTAEGSQFALILHDAGNKMAIDANDCRFGTAEAYEMYNFRIKSGGASSSTKNYFTLNIPEEGTLRLAPRTGSNAATDRALIITQGEDTLYNAIVQETQAVEVQEGEDTVKVYPYVKVAVAAGSVRVSYTAGMNFYSFAFKAGQDAPQPETAYYLVGNMNNWTLTADDAYKFVANPENEGEFVLHYTLAADDSFKVVEIASNAWYPAEGAEASNYVVDAAHAGEKDIYFRPDYQGGEDWHYGCIFVAANEVPTDAPAAAPAEPTYERYQVKAVYSAKYEADCNFGEWSSGTQYAQEAYGKKYVTNNNGYFGLEFSGMDCSEMEGLHLDVWIAADAQFDVYPIWGGTEQAKTVQLVGGQWNSINIALSEYDVITDWTNVYQIKIAGASNLTFWLNNVYFYTTQEKTVNIEDGYYLIGTMNDWDIHNLTADHKFAANPENEGEFVLHYTLAESNAFKVVSVASNEIAAWYPAEAGNFVVDFAHVGEKDIYFRPDYQGGEGWHAGCIFVAADANANPWETWFASGDSWNTETESYLEWDGENQKATVHINVDKNGQWRAQLKYHGPIAEAGKCYRVALKMKANHAINNVTIKYQDNVEMIYVNDAALAADVEYVFDQTVAGKDGGNGLMVLDFGFAKTGDIIEIYDVVIEEAECPEPQGEIAYYLVGSAKGWEAAEANLFAVNPDNAEEYIISTTLAEGEGIKVLGVQGETLTWYPDGEGNEYVVDAAHAGNVTIYFRPEGGVEGWYAGYFFVTETTGISNTAIEAKAVKFIENGQLIILKNGVKYNAQGTIVR